MDLPSIIHPSRAAYILGPERGNLSQEMQDQCDFIIKIPMSFCVNVAIAANIVMYDRLISLGRFAPRPVRAGAPTEPKPEAFYGGWISRTRDKRKADPEKFRQAPPPDYSVIDGALDDDD